MLPRIALIALTAVVALSAASTQASAPAGASQIPGDFDCHNAATAYDSLLLTTYLAGDELTHPSCPDIGDTSAANGLIAFEQGRNIATMQPNGADQHDIVTESTYAVFPAWSHDGKHVVFASGRSGPHEQLFVADADGSNATPLTTSSVDDAYARWSPDDTQIIFDSYNGDDNDIFIINANGTNRHGILTGTDSDYSPDWSPDGMTIVFISDRGTGFYDLFTMSPNGTNIHPLYEDDTYKGSPHYSPDGTKIVFSLAAASSDIATVSSGGGNYTPLTDDPARDSEPDWSPDGASILFDSTRDDPDPQNCDPCVQHIYRMDANGSHQTKLTQDGNDNDDPAQQPILSTLGDLNCDGVVDLKDLILSLRYAAGLPIQLPPGCPPIGP